MALRFQNKGDDVDREVEEPKMGLGCLFLGAVVSGAFYFAWDVFISGKSVNWAYRDMGWFAAFVFVVAMMERLVAPKYREFRVRTKEILGTVTEIEKAVSAIEKAVSAIEKAVSAIEKAVSAVKEDQNELLERLNAIEDELRSLSCRE